jgi:hypothetical protein
MPYFNRILGQYRATFESHTLPQAFPEIEAALRAAYSPNEGYSVRAAKEKKAWRIFVHKGLTTGFQIDFIPVVSPFGPAEAEIRVYRSSRLAQLSYHLMFGVGCCAIAIYFLGDHMSWWSGLGGIILLLIGALLSFALFLTFPAMAGLFMYFGGRLTDEDLTAIGQTVGEVIEKTRGVQHPGVKALPEPGATADGAAGEVEADQ